MRHRRLQFVGLHLFLISFICSETTTDDENVLKCPLGWGRGDGRSSTSMRVIPAEWINDGYCDCPTTGADEPETEACSGSEYWPGTTSSADQEDSKIFFQCPQQKQLQLSLSKLNDGVCDCCDGVDEFSSASAAAGKLCPDICQQVLAEERAARARLEETYAKGSQQRQTSVQAFAKLQKDVTAQIQHKQTELLDGKTQQLEQQIRPRINQQKLSLLQERINLAKNVAKDFCSADDGDGDVSKTNDWKGAGQQQLFMPLDDDELVWWIVHACQVAGEIANDQTQEKSTCVPLRLAGLDAGLTWQPQTYNLTRSSSIVATADVAKDNDDENDTARAEQLQKLADMLDHNVRHDQKIWNKKPNNNNDWSKSKQDRKRRRLQEEEEEEQVHHDDDHYEDDYGGYDDDVAVMDHGREVPIDDLELHDDDEEVPDEEYNSHIDDDDALELHDDDEEEDEMPNHQRRRDRRRRRQRHGRHRDGAKADEEDSKRHELENLIKQQSFSKSRVAFLDQSSDLILRINEYLKEHDDEAEEKEKEEEKEKKVDNKKKKEEEYDPVALPMVRGKLERRQKQVQRGLDYAVSSKVLLDAVQRWPYESEEQRREDLCRLAVGTLNHGGLSTLHVWQIFQEIIPELKSGGGDDDDIGGGENQTCRSPWAGSCPPKTIERTVEGKKFQIPSDVILKAGETFCEEQQYSTASTGTCARELGDKFPLEVPDGFLGYFEVNARSDDDPFEAVFKDLRFDNDAESRKELHDLEEEERRVEKEIDDLEAEIQELKESIGGEYADQLGPDGELHALRDTCHSIEAGKYTYEICLFGRASQKDKGGTGRGTDLGRWEEATIDEETGQRVWKWDRGARCWNGPQRSATAYVTCGSETAKILSAEEPDTCQYELEVESYIACDESFRMKHGL